MGTYLCLLVDVPGEGYGIVRNLLNVADGVEALLVVSCYKEGFMRERKKRYHLRL